MGILSRLFSKNDLALIEKLKKDIEKITKKSKSTFVSLIGVEGKAKGLDIVTGIAEDSPYSKKEIKKFEVILVEYYLKTKVLPLLRKTSVDEISQGSQKTASPTLKSVSYHYNYIEQEFSIIPLEFNSSLVIVALTPSVERILKELEKIKENIKKLGRKSE